MGKHDTTDLDRARDELFSHIRRCGVLEATPKQREEWLDETMEFLAERYPSLDQKDMKDLQTLGERYCRPAIPHGDNDALDAWSEEEEPAEVEEAVEPEAVDAGVDPERVPAASEESA